jgi:8-oxo-dGTP diphosphatase/2-hydroxy-dATP diphosphatase
MKKLQTIGMIRQGDKILLGMKKAGFGVGRWNGFGGKVEPDEDITAAMKREVMEECEITVEDFVEVGIINFYFEDKDLEPEVHIFDITSFSGKPVETDEMRPEWFDSSAIPYAEMWPADREWLEHYLSGRQFEGEVHFKNNNEVKSVNIIPSEIVPREGEFR